MRMAKTIDINLVFNEVHKGSRNTKDFASSLGHESKWTESTKGTFDDKKEKSDMDMASKIRKVSKLTAVDVFIDMLTSIPTIMSYLVKYTALAIPLILGGAMTLLFGSSIMEKLTNDETGDISILGGLATAGLGVLGYMAGSEVAGPIGGVLAATGAVALGATATDQIMDLIKKLGDAMSAPTGGTAGTPTGTAGETSGSAQDEYNEQMKWLQKFNSDAKKYLDMEGSTNFTNNMEENVNQVQSKLEAMDISVPYVSYNAKLGGLVTAEITEINRLNKKYSETENQLIRITEKIKQVMNATADMESDDRKVDETVRGINVGSSIGSLYMNTGTKNSGGGTMTISTTNNKTGSPDANAKIATPTKGG